MIAATGLCAAGPALAQERAAPSPESGRSQPADMATPDDLGAPLTDTGEPAGAADKPDGKTLSVDTPIGVIAASPQGRAVLDKDLPGLCKRPEYPMFKGLSPSKLAGLSHGRIKAKTLDHLQADLVQVSLTGEAPKAASPLAAGGRTIGRLSRSIYHRVVTVIAAL